MTNVQPHVLDVQRFINEQRFSSFQRLVLILCFLIVAIDGFDTAAIGFIAPAIRAQWQLDPAHLAPLFGAGLFGLTCGALIFGPLADRFGRKAILVFSVLFFGLASLASAFSPDMVTLLVLRFLTGLGLGGAMPSAITLTSEYCPARRRSGLVTLMFCGFTIGSALGGLVTAKILPLVGWHGVLAVGGVLPLLMVPVLLLYLPESVRYLVLNGKPAGQTRAILRRIAEVGDEVGRFVVGNEEKSKSAVGDLFRAELRAKTILLWIGFAMSLLIIYLLSSWLPTLLNGTGIDLEHASLVTAMFQIGGTLGAIGLGQLMDRYNPRKVLAVAYGLAAGFVALIGQADGNLVLLSIAVFGAGVCVSGSQVGMNALAASVYPTNCRATGVSWASAVGRCGSIVGSMSGGLMLSWGLGFPLMFALVALPSLVSAAALIVLHHQHNRQVAAGLVAELA